MGVSSTQRMARIGFAVLATIGLLFSLLAIASPAFAGEVIGDPDTEISKSASADTVAAGDSYSYTLTAVNDGDGLATGVMVSDNLDNDLVVDSVTPSQGTCDPVAAGNQVTCHIGSLEAGATATVTIAVTAPEDACPQVDNRASVWAENELNPDQTPEVSRSNIVVVNVVCGGESPDQSPQQSPQSSPQQSPQSSPQSSPEQSPRGTVAGGNPTPRPGGQLPNTAMSDMGELSSLVLLAVLLASIGTMVWVRLARRSPRSSSVR